MLTEIQQEQLTAAARELEKIVAAIKQWPWMERRQRWQPRIMTPEKLEILQRGIVLLNYAMTLLFARLEKYREPANLIIQDMTANERDLILDAAILLTIVKRIGLLPYRTGYPILPRRKKGKPQPPKLQVIK